MKALHITNYNTFQFVDPRNNNRLQKATEYLYLLEFLDVQDTLTMEGLRIANLLVPLMLVKMLLFSDSPKVVTIAAMLQIGNIFYCPPHSKH